MTIELEKYVNQPKEYDIAGLKVHPKPLKLRWLILFQPVQIRLNNFTKKESGLTDEEFKDVRYASYMKIFEQKFFSKDFDPNIELEKKKSEKILEIGNDFISQKITEEEKQKRIDAAAVLYRHVPTGKENLAELYSALIQEDVDWIKFFNDHLEQYEDIRKAGLGIYEDFFTEISELRKM